MRIEVHLHGNVPLRPGVTLAQVETALHSLLEYIDEENLADARSVYEDEPGIVFDPKERQLDFCWSGDVGRNFKEHVPAALAALNSFSERATEIEVTYYLDDGTDEYQLIFVGPTPESIHEAQRQAMIDDVSAVLGRQFGDTEIGEVVALLNQLFLRASPSDASRAVAASATQAPMSPQHRKRLH